MDPKRFSANQAGRLINIHKPVEDWAFIPAPLPPEWSPDTELFALLTEAVGELSRLDGAGCHIANAELLLRPLRQREALTSSSLEGTHATAEELMLFELSGDSKPESQSAAREVNNYARALELGSELLDDLPYCLRLIKAMHARLMAGVRGGNQRPGQFRESQVHIGSDRRFIPPPPSELDATLRQFEQSMHERPDNIHPLIWCYMVHYQFETIHPFNDGNGRVGRLLLALMISTHCKLSAPWLYMSPWFEKHKEEYIRHLFEVSATGAWLPWIKFCLRGTIEQSKDALVRLNTLIALKQGFLDKVSASDGAARLHTIVNGLFSGVPVTTIPLVQGALGISYPTAKSDLNRLEELGIVSVLKGNRRPKLYVAWEILQIGSGENR